MTTNPPFPLVPTTPTTTIVFIKLLQRNFQSVKAKRGGEGLEKRRHCCTQGVVNWWAAFRLGIKSRSSRKSQSLQISDWYLLGERAFWHQLFRKKTLHLTRISNQQTISETAKITETIIGQVPQFSENQNYIQKLKFTSEMKENSDLTRRTKQSQKKNYTNLQLLSHVNDLSYKYTDNNLQIYLYGFFTQSSDWAFICHYRVDETAVR